MIGGVASNHFNLQKFFTVQEEKICIRNILHILFHLFLKINYSSLSKLFFSKLSLVMHMTSTYV